VTDEEILRSKTAYYGLVTAMDRMIGQIFDSLEKNNLAENTLIVYSSDHGEQIGEHSLWWKQTFYEYSAKVPFIMSLPGVLPEGQSYDQNVSSLDLNATMLDLLNCPALPDSDGRSVRPIIEGEDWDNQVFSEYCTDDGYIFRMIKKDQWKLNYFHGWPCQLFNLQEDPMEQNDLAENVDYQSIKLELLEELLKDWNPTEIIKTIKRKEGENSLISAWANNTNPNDLFRWQLLPEMDYLESKIF
jgi:choline-sulfatase